MLSFFELSGISPNATPVEIKAAYRALALQHHPDKGGDPEEFKKIDKAYRVLEKEFTSDNVDMEDLPSGSEDIYGELLTKNPTLTSYVKIILACLDNKVINPAVILCRLLEAYLASSQSIYTLWGRTQWNAPLSKKISCLLKNENPDSALTQALKSLNEADNIYNETGFIEIFNAFFAFYPIYFTHLDNPAIRQKFHFTTIDDLVFNTILIEQAKQFFKSDSSRIYIEDAEINLLENTYFIGEAIDHIIKKLSSGELWRNLDVLVKFISYANKAQIQDKILPVILQALSAEKDDIHVISPAYKVLTKTIKRLDKDIIDGYIFPLLEKKSRKKYHSIGISFILGEIALISSAEITKKILPTLLSLLQPLNPREYTLRVLNSILHLIPDEALQEKVLPALLSEINERASMGDEVSKIIIRMAELAGKDQSVTKTIFVHTLKLEMDKKMQKVKYIFEDPRHDDKDITAQKENAIYYLRSFITITDKTQMQEKVLPIIRLALESPNPTLRRLLYIALPFMAELHDEILPPANKKELFKLLTQRLLRETHSKEKILEALAYEYCEGVLIHFIQFADDKEIIDEIFTTNLKEADLGNTSTIDVLGNHKLEKLAVACKLVDQSLVREMMPTLLLKLNFKEKPFKEALLNIFDQSFRLTEQKVIQEKILPVLLRNLVSISPPGKNISYANEIFANLNYPERVYYIRCLMKSYQNACQTSEHAQLLLGFYLLNKDFRQKQHANQLLLEPVSGVHDNDAKDVYMTSKKIK